MTLSVLVLTYNEEANLRACLQNVTWADEIVILDSGSTDATLTIVAEFDAKIYRRPFDDYATQRNYGTALCTADWVLSIDADERVSPELKAEIATETRLQRQAAYRICIRDYMFGRWVNYGSWPRQCPIRLYRRGYGFWDSAVHESLQVTGSVGAFETPLLHYSHLSIHRFLQKLNRYTDTEAQQWFASGIRKGWLVTILSPIRVFLIEYFTKLGYRDGEHGFILAVLLAIYFFVARIKLWELWYRHDHGITDHTVERSGDVE